MSEYIVELDSKHSIALKIAFAEEMRGGDFVRGEIVRCRDCKHYQDHNFGSKLDWCRHFHYDVHLDGFCKWGERVVE